MTRDALPVWIAACLIAATAGVAYHNSLAGPFIFDDLYHIVENTRIHRLWPLTGLLAGTARPVVTLSLALNYAIGRLAVSGYHLVNLAIHALAALTLFAIVRRTLRGRTLSARYARPATGLALTAAALWVAHPLNTQAVTYVIQRGESLASLLYLMMLYATIRGAASGRRAAGWYVAAVVSCALGAATKPVVASAPIVLLIYDRCFLAESFGDALKRRGWLYLGLAASWGVMLALGLSAPDPAAGFGLVTVTPLEYAATQPGVVLHYLRLALWPQPLVLDYGWPVARTAAAVVAPGFVVLALLAATLWASRGWRPAGFLGLWFALVLGPSSSFFPINDLAFEHRMYLALAAVMVLVALAGHAALSRVPWGRVAGVGLAALAVLGLCGLTVRRNADYRSEIAIWSDVVAKRPLNARGHNNLGRALLRVASVDRAIPELLRAERLAPGYAPIHNNLGAVAAMQGRRDEAIARYREALALNPGFLEARYNQALALTEESRSEEAIAQYRELLQRDPSSAEAWDGMGTAHERLGQSAEAIRCYREAVRVDPDFARAYNNLGLALAASSQGEEAIASYAAAIRLAPGVADYHVNLATALAGRGLLDEALARYRIALELEPAAPQIHNNIGIVLARQGRLDEAIVSFREALRIAPDFAMARRNLETALARQGRAGEIPQAPASGR